MTMNEPIIGIDLGTTNSAVGIVESGFPLLLADAENHRIIPSAVWYGEDNQIEVGRNAMRHRNSGIGTLITSAKRLIGHTEKSAPSYHLPLTTEESELFIVTKDRSISPIEVSSEILKELKRQAEAQLDYKVHKAVITVPAYFNDAQRSATKKAAELAELKVERIISEPTAAALAFGLDKLEEKSRVIVYDLGGGTFDVSILELTNGIFQVIATSGDTQLGGDDFDLILAEAIWLEHSQESFANLSFSLREQLTTAAKKSKEVLSDKDSFLVEIPFIRDTESLSVQVTRDKFEKLIGNVVNKTIIHCKQVMNDAQIHTPDGEFNSVILVGGSTRIPLVRQKVKELFKQEPDYSQHPDEAIALGAVIQGGILSGSLSKIILLDVTPLSLGIETYGGLMNVIIPRNTTIPCKAGEMFTNAVASQQSMSVRILQGEREMAKDNWQLGKIDIPFEPASKGKARVGIQFSIDENGILEVLTRDTHTQKDICLTIDSAAVDVSDDKVEAMVSESVEHAFTDMAERVFTEAKIKAEELLPAVEVALTQVGDQLSDIDKSTILKAQQEVTDNLSSKDANLLKNAVQKLDKATEHLATLLVEKAMEDALMNKLGQ